MDMKRVSRFWKTAFTGSHFRMTTLMLLAILVAIALLLGAGFSYEYGKARSQTRNQINMSQRLWCDALSTLIVSNQIDPKKMPTSYRLNEDFKKLEQEFGCEPKGT